MHIVVSDYCYTETVGPQCFFWYALISDLIGCVSDHSSVMLRGVEVSNFQKKTIRMASSD